MRLQSHETEVIKRTVRDFDKNAQIYLFGSRVDDSKKGGDIDLLIMSKKLTNTEK